MSLIDTGIYGAKVQSWRRSNPRDILKALIEKMPKASEQQLLSTITEKLKSDDAEEHLDSVIEYWFTNNYRSIGRAHDDPAKVRSARRARVNKIKKELKNAIHLAAKIILLDMVMPNGRPLRDCTGRDCVQIGGWLAKIAARIKPTEKVGAVLSEKQVRELFAK